MIATVNFSYAADYNPDTQYLPNRTTYGDLGIIEMPSARMAADGQLALNVSTLENTQRYSLAFQFLPWLEGAFRYSRLQDFPHPGRTDYDRSLGLKIRLMQESSYLPEVSVGIRDLIGTGIYGSEYFTASKTIWDFDVTTGMGWGRLASNETLPNPFGLILKSFNSRPRFSVQGGQVNFGQWFHGPYAGIFGGVVWHSPLDGVDVLAEYSSDRYTNEIKASAGSFHYKMPFNFGVSYHPYDEIALTAGWLYGSTLGVTLTISADPTAPNYSARIGPEPMPISLRTAEERRTAVTHFVDNRAQVRPEDSVGAWVDVSDHRNVVQARLTSELTNLSGQVADFEIDGKTLMINLHGERHPAERCKTYAKLAANSGAAIDSVAVADLNNPSGNVAVCEVPEDAQANVVLASATLNDDGDLISATATQDTTLDAAPSYEAPAQNAPMNIPDIERKIRADADAQSLGIEAISIGQSEAVVYIDNETYYFEAEAIGRLVRVLMADTPSDIEVFRIVSVVDGIALRQTRIERAPLERMYLVYGHVPEVQQAVSVELPPRNNPVLDAGQRNTYPRFSWAISPQLREGLFDPKRPIEFELAGVATGSIDILPGLSLDAAADGSIWNNYDTSRNSNSKLPHVRSDWNKYFKQGSNGIGSLSVDYITTVAPDVYVMGRAGILEDMFAGAGAQVLWRPSGQRWAIGADAYEVWQRGFDRLIDLQHYRVLTGHVTVYYQSPWYGLNFAIHAGRYLAGDYGATFEITRRFDTGVEVGAFATFTNVPFKTFGEGSFDKGILIHIPLEWMLPFFTQSSYDLALRPLSRDGGQRLAGDDSLYGITDSTSGSEIAGHIDDIAYPPH